MAFASANSTSFPRSHHRDAAADVFHDGEIVGDEEVRDASLLLQILEQVDDLRLDRDIQGADRFVAHDQFRFDGEGARDADALPLAAAELMRITLRVSGVEPDRLQQFRDPIPPGGFVLASLWMSRGSPTILDGQARVQRPVGILKYDLQLPPARAEFDAPKYGQVVALKKNASGSRFDQPHNRATQGCLAATAFAHRVRAFRRVRLRS